MTYVFLTDAKKVIDWARTLIRSLNQREAALEKRLAEMEARLTAGGL